jgi:hypothetical protein
LYSKEKTISQKISTSTALFWHIGRTRTSSLATDEEVRRMCTKFIAALSVSGVLLGGSIAHAQAPPPWKSADVGNVGTPGHVTVGSSNDWHVAGAGSNIWGTADSFFYVYQPIRDGRIVAHVDAETNTDPFAKAGVMIRQTLDPGSPEVILDVKPDGGIEFMTRSTAGGETTFIAGGSVPVTAGTGGTVDIGVDVQLARNGNTVSAAYCKAACTVIGTTEFPAGPALAGIAVTSRDPSQINDAYFRTPPTLDSVPFPWSTVDVGDVGTSGSATFDNATGTFFVSGAGSDIWGGADSFRAVTRPLFGDSALTVRVVSQDATNAFAKAGLMMSADVSPTSARVILDVKPDGGVEFMARPANGGEMSFVAGSTTTFPVWLRLTQMGNQFVGEISSDGISWTPVGSVAVAMASMNESGITFGGLAVTSHDPGTLNNAVFDKVGVTTGIGRGPVGPNLLVNAGFEDSIPPNVGPGWVSDTPLRQTDAISETAAPHTGAKNAVCKTPSGDCGIYQETTGQGELLFSIYARADHPGALIGMNVNGQSMVATPVMVGGYQRYTVGVCTCSAPETGSTPVVRVWMYAPPGLVVDVDDAELVQDLGPH